MKIVQPSFEIIDHSNLTTTIEIGGRTCYKSEDKICDGSADPFIEKIKNFKHESVLEHGIVTVRFVCDRGVSHELVRHRLASFSQESTRYCNYAKGKFGNEITVVEPQSVLTQRQYDCWMYTMEGIEEQYLEMVRLGCSAQQARSVLPNSLKTEVVVSANPREWRHIFTTRTHRDAHPDMVASMRPVLREFRARWPVLFNDVGTLDDTSN
jgi:thymidylate synthase (FAD)